jgi:serine/threonine protein phosphatase PrpC
VSAASATATACPQCGQPLAEGDRFCEECGFDLAAPPADGPLVPASSAGAGHDADADTGAGPEGTPGRNGSAEDGISGDGQTAYGTGPAIGLYTGDPGGPADDDTLALAVPARLSDPREGAREDPREESPAEAAAPGAVCVACGVGGVDNDGYCEHCGHAQPRQRDHQEQELEGVAAVSDRGLRHHRNEDAFTLATASLPDGSPGVAAVVCDGVSTAYRPDDASAAASAAGSDSLLAALERGSTAEDAMRGALLAAFDAVTALAAEDTPDGVPHHNAPACTCVGAVITGPVFTVGWIGDSRAYWIPDDRALPSARLTEDDSWAARMVSAGLMTETEAYADARAHAITGWLGADAVEVDPHVSAFQPEGPGVIVVCTDGLWNYAESASEMAEAVPADARTRPLHSARALLGLALDGGGHDNVTVAVLPFPAAVSRAGFPPA